MFSIHAIGNPLIPLDEDNLPNPDELPLHYAVPVVRVLQISGHPMLAVDYTYRVLRSHCSGIEAHKTYVGSLMPTAPLDRYSDRNGGR